MGHEILINVTPQEARVAMLEQGRIDPAPMITDRIGLAGVPAMFETLARPTTQAKVLIEPGARC